MGGSLRLTAMSKWGAFCLNAHIAYPTGIRRSNQTHSTLTTQDASPRHRLRPPPARGTRRPVPDPVERVAVVVVVVVPEEVRLTVRDPAWGRGSPRRRVRWPCDEPSEEAPSLPRRPPPRGGFGYDRH